MTILPPEADPPIHDVHASLSEMPIDLPLNIHPAGTGVLWVDTPIGAGGATDIRAELSGGAARVSVAVVRCSANSIGV